MVLLSDGTVLAAGGITNSSHSGITSSSETYNPVNRTWMATAGTMATARLDFKMVLLPDGSVLAAGGTTNGVAGLASSEIYNPVTRT